MKEVLPDIFQMTLTLSGFSPGSINVYLIRDSDGYAIVDTGWDMPPAIKSMEEQLDEFNIRFKEIKRVIITHCHVDHLGMIGRFKESHNAIIYLHQNEIDLIKIRFNNGDQYVPMTDRFLIGHGVPPSELAPPEIQIPNIMHLAEPDILLEGNEEITIGKYCFRVINTPGHTPGHISLYESQKKFLISGDVLLPTIATNAAFHVQHIPNPMKKYLNSLGVLKELEIYQVLPGHEYIFSNHRSRIDEIIKHHRKKYDEILNIMGEREPKTAYDISLILSQTSKDQKPKWAKLSDWDKRFSVLQTIAFLEEMACENKAIRFSKDSKIYYQMS